MLDTTSGCKRLLGNSCQAEEFIVRVEMIGHVRHRILKLHYVTRDELFVSFFRMPDKFLFRIYSKLLFISIFRLFLPSIRILVSEYVDNGNLHQWLYGFSEQVSPLIWVIRMNIIQGIVKEMCLQLSSSSRLICWSSERKERCLQL
ncbi:hypothetical protein SADUNF_Sadunf04G0050300 [Salix dunnii]|uniref:non-specific serine/threonine protein kinase n=1 Tax=Salix dunnii TaxID=1413687 RepID=A0A835K6Z2_9ROSI|nr:hypothetical protein SADUNF_Sadunf04G0050300 [Salix dunnii]